MIHLGLTGYPLGHSLSPRIHTAALNACKLEGEYSLFPVHPDDRQGLADLVSQARNGKITGLNVTIPHKQNVIELLDELTPTARSIGAANTIYMKEGRLVESPIYIEGMISEASAIHMSYAHYLGSEVRKSVLQGINPFQSEYFHPVTHPSEREEIVAGGPCVIIATSGMLEGGPAIDYFRHLAPDPRNTLAYVSYQVEGTLGNRIKNGLKEVSLYAHDGKIEMVKVGMRVESIEGFSGHSDRNQLLAFVKRMMPKPTRIIVNHGERRKSDMFAQSVNRIFGIKTVVPDVLESIRLR